MAKMHVVSFETGTHADPYVGHMDGEFRLDWFKQHFENEHYVQNGTTMAAQGDSYLGEDWKEYGASQAVCTLHIDSSFFGEMILVFIITKS